jgi:hypothetical protein
MVDAGGGGGSAIGRPHLAVVLAFLEEVLG